MELQGLHHITMITGDAQKNIDFYADTLGLRLVKKTVNFDAPDAYHLYFADEVGTPGTILTWFEFAGARRGRAGAGHDPHDPAGRRLRARRWTSGPRAWAWNAPATWSASRTTTGCEYELVVSDAEPQRAVHPEIPEAFAITGIVGARAFGQTGPHPRADRDARLRHRRRRLHARRLPLGLRRAAGRARADGRRHRAPHRLGLARRGPPGVAGARGRGRPGRERRPRPRLLPVDLLRRAARDPVRDRDALARASRSTRRPSRSARRCASRSSTSTCARSWRRC